MAKPVAQPAPRALGRYELITQIGSGGMADVWLARTRAHAGFVRQCAVKILRPAVLTDPRERTRFLREAELAASIHHANVVGVIDVGEEDGLLYQAMTYVDGDSLAGLLRRARGGLPIGVVLGIVIDALHGLHAAHEARSAEGVPLAIVHRDVSPQNILVGRDGVARISDFGIALSSADELTGSQLGKFAYFAPEQVERKRLDRRTDVFAAGIVSWEALSGRRLFKRDDFADSFAAILSGDIPAVPGIPAPIEAVLRSALERDPACRPASAAAFAAALAAAAAASGVVLERSAIIAAVESLAGPAASAAAPKLAAPVPSTRWRGPLAGAALLLAAIAIAAVARRPRPVEVVAAPPAPASTAEKAAEPPTPQVVSQVAVASSTAAPPPSQRPRRRASAPTPPYTANPFGGR